MWQLIRWSQIVMKDLTSLKDYHISFNYYNIIMSTRNQTWLVNVLLDWTYWILFKNKLSEDRCGWWQWKLCLITLTLYFTVICGTRKISLEWYIDNLWNDKELEAYTLAKYVCTSVTTLVKSYRNNYISKIFIERSG